MTIAFLSVITGLQHFDGLIDLGNAVGLRNVQDRKMKAHAWTVTSAGAVLALVVEFLAFAGLFLTNWLTVNITTNLFLVFSVIFLAEVSAKLSMVTIVWVGKPSHKGLGSIFLAKAKKKLNFVAYLISPLIVYPVFYFSGYPIAGLAAIALVFVSIPVAYVMNKVSEQRLRRSFGRHDWSNQRGCKGCCAGFVCGGADSNMRVPAFDYGWRKRFKDGFVNGEAVVAVSG